MLIIIVANNKANDICRVNQSPATVQTQMLDFFLRLVHEA